MKKKWTVVVCCMTFAFALPAAAQDDLNTTADVKPVGMTEEDLAIWNSSSFKRQFALSYLAETDIEPRINNKEREKMQEILEMIQSDRMDEAMALLQKNRGQDASAVFDFTLGNIHFQKEQFDQAAAVYQVAVEKYPKFLRAWKNLGVIQIRQHNYEGAIPALTKVIELGGGDAISYGLLGFSYSNVENHLSAESAYRMANLLDPATMDWKMGLARSFFKQERYADAVALTRQLINDDPQRTDLWMLQANAYIGLNQAARAAENYQIVDRLGGSTPESLNMLADIYVNDELYDLAVGYYLRALKEGEKTSPDRAIRAAKLLVARGANSETRVLVEGIESLRGDSLNEASRKDLLKLRARVAVAEGSGDEEARVLEEIVAMDPLDGEALILLGQHSVRAGENEKAIFYYERAASIEKHEADAKVRHAQLLVQLGKYSEALPLLRSAQKIKPRENIQQYLDQVERVAKAR